VRRIDPVKREKKRQELLAAARACFLKAGLRGTSIADICVEAGISPGHLYHYFDSKEDIIEAIFDQAIAAGAAQFAELIERSNSLGAIAMVIEEAKKRNFKADFLSFLEILGEVGRNAKLRKILQEGSRKRRVLLAELLRQGQQKGPIDPSLKPDATAAILLALLDGVRMMAVCDPDIKMEEVLDQLTIMLGRSLVPPR
jgi:TetR/AcrR family transcriptional regulator, repressor for uid operon